MDLDQIKDRYVRLRKVYGEMVGTLYPGIAYRDLTKLREEYRLTGGDLNDLPYILPPRVDGSAPPGIR